MNFEYFPHTTYMVKNNIHIRYSRIHIIFIYYCVNLGKEERKCTILKLKIYIITQ